MLEDMEILYYSYNILLILNQTRKINKALLVATGCLHSPMSVQQKQSIPTIAHAVALEME